MLSYSEIFNITKTTLPLTKKELETILDKSVFTGYVQCPYNKLIDTLKEIAYAETYTCSVNPDVMYQNGNNPLNMAECVISVEGIRYYEEFINRVVSTDDAKEWTDFVTYSETFKAELRNLKTKVIEKILWNSKNLNNWFEEKSVALLQTNKNELMTDFEVFKKKVLLTSDLYGFIDSCEETELQKAIRILSKNLLNKLQKYRHELMQHIYNNSKREPIIVIKHPIIKKIFITSALAKQCKKEWPKIKFTSLDKRSFDSISLWDE